MTTPAIFVYSLVNKLRDLMPLHIRKFRYAAGDNYQLLLRSNLGNISLLFNYSQENILLTNLRLPPNKRQPNWIREINRIIENSKVLELDNPNFERILSLKVKKFNDIYNLYIEVFGGGNTILTDSNENIIAIDKKLAVKHRLLRKKEKYKLPPARGFDPRLIDEINTLKKKIKSKKDFYKIFNLDKYTIREIFTRINLTYENREQLITEKEVKIFLDMMKELLRISSKGIEGYSIIEDDKKRVILPYMPKHRDPVLNTYDIYKSTEHMIKELIDYLDKRDIYEKKKRLEKEIDRIKKKRNELVKEIEVLNQKLPLLYTKLREIEIIFNKARKGELKDFNVDYDNKIIMYPLNENIMIPLKYDVSPFKAISILYDKEYKRKKSGIKKIEKRISELEKKLLDIKKNFYEPIESISKTVLKKKKWYEKFRWSKTSGGLLLVGGREAYTNEILIRRYLENDDLIFHSDYYGSPFVILKKGINAKEEDIKEAAIFTASFSRGWKDQIHALDVYYVQKDQLSKKAPSGEFLKKGSFMIYGKKNYVRKTPLILWLGIETDDKNLFIGPPPSVKKHCLKRPLFELIPGDKRKADITKKILENIKKTDVIKITLETERFYHDYILSILPPGKTSIRIIV